MTIMPVVTVFGTFSPVPSDGYLAIVLALNPVAFWPLNETSGTVADNAEGTAARDGVYAGVALNQTDGPFLTSRAGLWDGANDYCDVYSASLNGVFSGAEGSFAGWFKVSSGGVWLDGSIRVLMQLVSNASTDYVQIYRSATNNRLSYLREGANIVESVNADGVSSTGWFHVGLTWSQAADQVKAYLNGVQTGSTRTGLGAYSGALDANLCLLGANTKTPTQVWSGYIQYVGVWNVVLTAANFLTLYNGGPL